MRFGNPISSVNISGGTINNQQPQRLLGTVTIPAGQTSASATFTILNTDQALMFVGEGSNIANPIAQVVAQGVTSNSFYFSGQVNTNDWALCPLGSALDSQIHVILTVPAAAIASITFAIIARSDPIVSYLAGVQSSAEINRSQPVLPSSATGLKFAFGNGASGTLIAAANPLSIRLWALSLEGVATSGNIHAFISLNDINAGTSARIPDISAVTTTHFTVAFASGLILPFGATVTYASGGTGASAECSAVYDLIAAA